MKTIYSIIALACGLVWSSPAIAESLLNGPATFDLTCTTQALQHHQISAKTNLVRSVTNATYVLDSTVTNFTLNTSSLLDLITNSLNTNNIPTGAQLLLEGAGGNYSLALSDSTGTNVFMYLGALLQPNIQAIINVGKETETITNQTAVSTGNDTEAYTSEISFIYDDTSMSPANGLNSVFTLNCQISSKSSRNVATETETENVMITVTGGGHILGGPPTIITGTIRAKITGHIPLS